MEDLHYVREFKEYETFLFSRYKNKRKRESHDSHK